MITDLLHQQLSACILDALRQQAYAPPRTPDTRITDQFYTDAAQLLLERVMAESWAVVPPKYECRNPLGPMKPSTMTPAEAEEGLRFSIRAGLMRYRYKPPRSRKLADVERYHRSVADAVMESILRSNWELAPALLKKPPTRMHSTFDFMEKDG